MCFVVVSLFAFSGRKLFLYSQQMTVMYSEINFSRKQRNIVEEKQILKSWIEIDSIKGYHLWSTLATTRLLKTLSLLNNKISWSFLMVRSHSLLSIQVMKTLFSSWVHSSVLSMNALSRGLGKAYAYAYTKKVDILYGCYWCRAWSRLLFFVCCQVFIVITASMHYYYCSDSQPTFFSTIYSNSCTAQYFASISVFIWKKLMKCTLERSHGILNQN